ncbi:MAG TPA: PIN domain-containing protein [Pyrinomonadaceae bacterium]|nr:PIN domain-containing protein [Pyrinomonadaceae bacterium]
MKNSLIDTGYLFAVFDEKDSHHQSCRKIFEREIVTAILPDVVIPEIAYLILRELNVKTLVEFLRAIAEGEYLIVRTTADDLNRAAEILEKFNDNNIDLVDACIVAIAERLGIEKILTIDRRHFSVFKPIHCESFKLLPE